MAVERSSWRELGSSARVGRSMLYMDEEFFGSGEEQPGELVAGQHEAGGHHGDVGAVGMAQEAAGAPPAAHRDQDRSQRQQLADLDTDVERQQVGDKAV